MLSLKPVPPDSINGFLVSKEAKALGYFHGGRIYQPLSTCLVRSNFCVTQINSLARVNSQ